MKPHPFTGAGPFCDWCSKIESDLGHIAPLMDWAGAGDKDGSLPFICGIVMMSLYKDKQDPIATVEAVRDPNGDYTNVTRLTTLAGNVYDVTVTQRQ